MNNGNGHDNDDLRVHHIRPARKNKSPADEFLDNLQNMFKGGKGGGGGNGSKGPPTPNNLAKVIPLFFLFFALIIGTFTCFYTVDVSEEGVVTRFGRYARTTGPGAHFKLPFGIESVIKVQSKRVLQEEFGFRTADTNRTPSSYDKSRYVQESLMLTGDLNVADVEWVVQYRISDPWKYLFHARDVRRNIRDVSMSIMRRVVGDRLVSEVLTTGRQEVAQAAKELCQEVLDSYDIGIRIVNVILQDVNPPDRVKPAFNEVNGAKQEQEQTINNAEKAYNKVIPEARGKAEQQIADAEAYAIDVVNRAKGDASQFNQVLSAYKKAPDITRRRLYLDTMEDIFSRTERFTIIDKDLKGILPLLPMPSPTSKETH